MNARGQVAMRDIRLVTLSRSVGKDSHKVYVRRRFCFRPPISRFRCITMQTVVSERLQARSQTLMLKEESEFHFEVGGPILI